jgi:predicted XRE-type DNA-binding protein
MTRKIKVETGSGNIFADLGLPDAETHFLKAQIVAKIYRLTKERKLTQAAAGKRMGITQPEVSRMFRGNFREYSVDRLMEFLTAFDRDVEIRVRPHKKAGTQGQDHVQSTGGVSPPQRSSSRVQRPARALLRACAIRRRKRGSFSSR